MKLNNVGLTYAQVQANAVSKLLENGINSARHDVELLFRAAAELNHAQLISREGDACPTGTIEQFDTMIDRRIIREPVFRIIGEREFHGLRLSLGEDTLEPRDDTEALVQLTLDVLMRRKPDYRCSGQSILNVNNGGEGITATNFQFADLGTGTGAIALALLSELPRANCVASDISNAALDVARQNARSNGLIDRFAIAHGSWLEPLKGEFDFIVSNPPYIASLVVDELEPEVVQFDPRIALNGGDDGLTAYREIFSSASEHLKPGGFLALEIGFDQKKSVIELSDEFRWRLIGEQQDLNQNDRAVAFSR